jgi:hypothetical protein
MYGEESGLRVTALLSDRDRFARSQLGGIVDLRLSWTAKQTIRYKFRLSGGRDGPNDSVKRFASSSSQEIPGSGKTPSGATPDAFPVTKSVTDGTRNAIASAQFWFYE